MSTMFNNKKPAINAKQTAESIASAPDEAAIDRMIEEKIDRDLSDSFPASDPPGWTLGIRRRRS